MLTTEKNLSYAILLQNDLNTLICNFLYYERYLEAMRKYFIEINKKDMLYRDMMCGSIIKSKIDSTLESIPKKSPVVNGAF